MVGSLRSGHECNVENVFVFACKPKLQKKNLLKASFEVMSL